MQNKKDKKDPAWALIGFLEIGGDYSTHSQDWRVAKLKRKAEKELNIKTP